MRGTVIYGAGDVRSEDIPEPHIVAPTDAIVRNAATCVCGSDLWEYRGALRVATRQDVVQRAGGEELSDRELAEQAEDLDTAVRNLGA